MQNYLQREGNTKYHFGNIEKNKTKWELINQEGTRMVKAGEDLKKQITSDQLEKFRLKFKDAQTVT